MKVIYKYEIPAGEICKFKMPRERSLAKVDRDPKSGNPAVWFIVERDTHLEEVKYMVFGTGMEIPNSCSYVGTAICAPFVWHVFRIHE